MGGLTQVIQRASGNAANRFPAVIRKWLRCQKAEQDPAGSFEAQETKFLLARAIEQLGEREKIVLVLYYYEGMTLAEIGRVLGVTESRISQMHTAAMLRLRAKLTESERA